MHQASAQREHNKIDPVFGWSEIECINVCYKCSKMTFFKTPQHILLKLKTKICSQPCLQMTTARSPIVIKKITSIKLTSVLLILTMGS